jgi:hypothetical protein
MHFAGYIPGCGQFQSKGQRVCSLAHGMEVGEPLHADSGAGTHDSEITMDSIPKRMMRLGTVEEQRPRFDGKAVRGS